VTFDQWVTVVCEELGLDRPDPRAVLDFARDVAHRVDRPAAPLTCLLMGLAAREPGDLASIIERLRGFLPPEPA
jgi:hypothetical protein